MSFAYVHSLIPYCNSSVIRISRSHSHTYPIPAKIMVKSFKSCFFLWLAALTIPPARKKFFALDWHRKSSISWLSEFRYPLANIIRINTNLIYPFNGFIYVGFGFFFSKSRYSQWICSGFTFPHSRIFFVYIQLVGIIYLVLFYLSNCQAARNISPVNHNTLNISLFFSVYKQKMPCLAFLKIDCGHCRSA